MPRKNRKKTSAAKGGALAEATDWFPLVVETFKGPKPGEEHYNPDMDKLLIGFQYGSQTVPTYLGNIKLAEITPYEFLTNPQTGLRQGQMNPPGRSSFQSLDRGVSKWMVIPPKWVWEQGTWLSNIVQSDAFAVDELPYFEKEIVAEALTDWPASGVPKELYQLWAVSGEGTPGNYRYRIYEVPDVLCAKAIPDHPDDWPEKLRESQTTTSYGNGYTRTSQTKTTTTTTTTASPYPAGSRVRCPSCGHWYSFPDLIQHSVLCGDPELVDVAIMCHTDCGCRTLDQSSVAKPGFPRAKTKSEVNDADHQGDAEQPVHSVDADTA